MSTVTRLRPERSYADLLRENAHLRNLEGFKEYDTEHDELLTAFPRIYALSKQPMQILSILFRNRERYVSRDAIFSWLFSHIPECDQPTEKTIEVQLSKVRRLFLDNPKYNPEGWLISVKFGTGWKLTKQPQEQNKAIGSLTTKQIAARRTDIGILQERLAEAERTIIELRKTKEPGCFQQALELNLSYIPRGQLLLLLQERGTYVHWTRLANGKTEQSTAASMVYLRKRIRHLGWQIVSGAIRNKAAGVGQGYYLKIPRSKEII